MSKEQNTKQLPNGWKRVKLLEVGQIETGTTPSKNEQKYYGSEFPLFKPTDLNQGINTYKASDNLSKSGYEKTRKLPINSILVTCIGATIGKTGLIKVEGASNQQINAIIPNQHYLPKFVFFQIISRRFQELIKSNASSTTLPILNKSKFGKLDFISTSYSQQKVVVSKIDELFSELDKGIEQLKTAQQQLKIYRQAVLKWAFEGKLTSNNVKEGELPQGWSWSLLGEVSKVSGGLTKNSKRESLKIKLPFLRVANVYFNFLDLNDVHTIGINENEMERVRLEKDDLLFVEGNGSIEQIGRVALWNGSIANCVHQNHLIKSRFSNRVVPKYALYFFCSTIGRAKIKEQANSTSGLHTLSLGKISNLKLPLSPIEEQKKIVLEIESRLSVADKMEETINQSLQQAEALRQSILKKAFEGKLVATDTIETIKEQAKVIPLERKVLAGKIIHLLHDDKHFGLTKFQKILYLVENYTEVPYETNFLQDRAGPHDKDFTLAFRKEMQENDWLQEEQKGKTTKFILGDNIGSLIKDYAVYFRDKSEKFVFIIKLLKDKSTHEAELIATLYAVWNNRLIKKKPVKIDLLVEDFFNWSPKKKEEFQPEEVLATFKWMKKTEFVPSGFGKVIGTN